MVYKPPFNPLDPPILGELEVGGHPQTPGRGAKPLCTPQLLNNPKYAERSQMSLQPPFPRNLVGVGKLRDTPICLWRTAPLHSPVPKQPRI